MEKVEVSAGQQLAQRLERMPLWGWVTTLVLVSLLASLSWGLYILPRQNSFDEVGYVRHAVDLSQGRGFVEVNGEPSAYWPVGYPALLAIAYKATGRNRVTEMGLQVLFGISTCLLISTMGAAAFGRGIGRLAALLLALYPTHVFYSTLNLTEPACTFLMTAALALSLKSLRVSWTALPAGPLFAFALLVRPAVVLLGAVLPVWYWIQRQGTRGLLLSAMTGCVALATISPWLARNHEFTGSWAVISTTGGENLLVGNYPGAFGGYARDLDRMKVLYDGNRRDYSRGYALGINAILSHPWESVIRAFRKLTYFFALETDGVMWNLKGLPSRPSTVETLVLLALANGPYVVMLALCVLGLLRTPLSQPLASLFLLTVGYFVAIALVFFGDPRYHYPLIPLAMVFSAKAIVADLPVLFDPANRRVLWRWAWITAGFVSLMAINLVVKMAEIRTLEA